MCEPISSRTALSRRGLIRAGTGVLAAAALGVLPDPTDWMAPYASAQPATTRFRPVTPTRLVDTRSPGGWRRLDRNRLRAQIVGRAGVPESAVAVAVTVAAIGRPAAGSIMVVPSATDTDAPPLPPLELGRTGTFSQTRFVRLGDAGALDIHRADGAMPVTLDIVGYFEPAESTSAGRVVTIPPVRTLETSASADPFRPYEVREVTTGGAAPTDATAVLVNITGSTAPRAGHWKASPGAEVLAPRVLELSAGETAAAFAVVPLERGAFRLYSSAGGHVAVDVVGYVTGESAEVSSDGLFVPETPTRVLDTRLADDRVRAGTARELVVGPEFCSAVAVSVATLGSIATGETAVWAAGDRRPAAPTVHYGPQGAATENFALVPAGRRGIAVSASGGDAHLVIDAYGWFTGTRSEGRLPVAGAQPYGIHGIEMESFADEWLDYGTSTDGRPLRAFRHGSGDRHALLTTALHGNEHSGTSILADLVTRPPIPGWTLWMIPIANPDARAANARYAHDVDMNRDFPVEWSALLEPTPSGCVSTRTGPAPASLVETQRLMEAITSGPFRKAEVSISHHDNYNWVAPQVGSREELRQLADGYALTTGLRLPGENGRIVPTSPEYTRVKGGFETFAHSLGMASFLVENKAGYLGDRVCAGTFGLQPTADAVAPHSQALRALLTDARLSP